MKESLFGEGNLRKGGDYWCQDTHNVLDRHDLGDRVYKKSQQSFGANSLGLKPTAVVPDHMLGGLLRTVPLT